MKTINLRGLTPLFLVFSLFVVIGIGAAAAAPSVSINPDLTEDLGIGQTFTITVEVDSDTHNLRTLSTVLTYDATALQVTNIDESNNLFGTSYMTEPGSGDDGAGTIRYGMASTEGTYTPSDGAFITIEFKVKAGAADATYPIGLQDVVLLNQDNSVIPGVDVTDGNAKVGYSEKSEPKVYIAPELTKDLGIGQTFTITVEVDSDTHNLRTLSTVLTYDATALQVTNIDESNNLFGTSYMTEPGSGDDGAGTIRYGMASTEGTYTPSDGAFITIEFKVKAGAADTKYPIDLQDVVLLNQDNSVIPGVVVTDGTVVVSSNNPPTADVTYPTGGTVSGTIVVTANANDPDPSGSVTQVKFFLIPDGSAIGTDTNGADGWSVQLDTTTVDDGAYQIKAVATDDEGAKGDDTGGEFTIDNSCPCDFCLELVAGLNFVSIPRVIDDGPKNATTVFDVDYYSGECCIYYDALAGSFDLDADVKPCRGFLVYKKSAKTVCVDFDDTASAPSQKLYVGWNTIGYPRTVAIPINDDADPDFASITGLEDADGTELFRLMATYRPGTGWIDYPAGSLTDATPGAGYWIYMTQDCTMSGGFE